MLYNIITSHYDEIDKNNVMSYKYGKIISSQTMLDQAFLSSYSFGKNNILVKYFIK